MSAAFAYLRDALEIQYCLYLQIINNNKKFSVSSFL